MKQIYSTKYRSGLNDCSEINYYYKWHYGEVPTTIKTNLTIEDLINKDIIPGFLKRVGLIHKNKLAFSVDGYKYFPINKIKSAWYQPEYTIVTDYTMQDLCVRLSANDLVEWIKDHFPEGTTINLIRG